MSHSFGRKWKRYVMWDVERRHILLYSLICVKNFITFDINIEETI